MSPLAGLKVWSAGIASSGGGCGKSLGEPIRSVGILSVAGVIGVYRLVIRSLSVAAEGLKAVGRAFSVEEKLSPELTALEMMSSSGTSAPGS